MMMVLVDLGILYCPYKKMGGNDDDERDIQTGS